MFWVHFCEIRFLCNFFFFFSTLLPLETACFSFSAGDIKQEVGAYREGPPYQRRGSLQLWQFLVALLDDPTNSHFIAWTGRGMEFKLIEPEEVKPSSFSAGSGEQLLVLSMQIPCRFSSALRRLLPPRGTG